MSKDNPTGQEQSEYDKFGTLRINLIENGLILKRGTYQRFFSGAKELGKYLENWEVVARKQFYGKEESHDS